MFLNFDQNENYVIIHGKPVHRTGFPIQVQEVVGEHLNQETYIDFWDEKDVLYVEVLELESGRLLKQFTF